MFASLKAAARRIRQDSLTVYFAARHPRTPLLVRALALLVAAYALSPIDLIPDFIPVLGYLDDVLLLPLGILLVIRLTPAEVIAASREQAAQVAARPVSKGAAAVIVALWLAGAAAAVHWLRRAWLLLPLFLLAVPGDGRAAPQLATSAAGDAVVPGLQTPPGLR